MLEKRFYNNRLSGSVKMTKEKAEAVYGVVKNKIALLKSKNPNAFNKVKRHGINNHFRKRHIPAFWIDKIPETLREEIGRPDFEEFINLYNIDIVEEIKI